MRFIKRMLHCGVYPSDDGDIVVTPERIRWWAAMHKRMTQANRVVPSKFDHDDELRKSGPISQQEYRMSLRNSMFTAGRLEDIRPTADGKAAELVMRFDNPKAAQKAEENNVFLSPVVMRSIPLNKGTYLHDVLGQVDIVDHPVDNSQGPFVKVGESDSCVGIRMSIGNKKTPVTRLSMAADTKPPVDEDTELDENGNPKKPVEGGEVANADLSTVEGEAVKSPEAAQVEAEDVAKAIDAGAVDGDPSGMGAEAEVPSVDEMAAPVGEAEGELGAEQSVDTGATEGLGQEASAEEAAPDVLPSATPELGDDDTDFTDGNAGFDIEAEFGDADTVDAMEGETVSPENQRLITQVMSDLESAGIAAPQDVNPIEDPISFVTQLAASLRQKAIDDQKAKEAEAAEVGNNKKDDILDEDMLTTHPQFAAMSLRVQKLEQVLGDRCKLDQIKRIEKLAETGRCTPAEKDRKISELSTQRMSLRDDGTQDRVGVMDWIDDRENLPEGAAVPIGNTAKKMGLKGKAMPHPDVVTGGQVDPKTFNDDVMKRYPNMFVTN